MNNGAEPCFRLRDNGHCDRPNCGYDHAPELIKAERRKVPEANYQYKMEQRWAKTFPFNPPKGKGKGKGKIKVIHPRSEGALPGAGTGVIKEEKVKVERARRRIPKRAESPKARARGKERKARAVMVL